MNITSSKKMTWNSSSFAFILVFMILFLVQSCESNEDSTKVIDDQSTFLVKGTYLTDPCGDTVILKGVNKMSVFDEEDIYGANYFPEIAKTGANSVRIVWQSYYSNGNPSRTGQLDTLIANCIKSKMIPIVEMHDATCYWEGLDEVIDYWKLSEMIRIVDKYKNALLVNIANEAGDYSISSNQFYSKYNEAISELRQAGISVPLIIDAPDCGKNLEAVVPVAGDLIENDPLHNLIFSTHPYWSKKDGATPLFIKEQLDYAANNEVPLILGELCAYGGWPGEGADEVESCSAKGEVDYQALLTESANHDMGWLVWEWGPGNGFYDREPAVLCPAMDMTSNGNYQSILNIQPNDVNAWVKDVVIDNPLGLKQTASKTTYIAKGFRCE